MTDSENFQCEDVIFGNFFTRFMTEKVLSSQDICVFGTKSYQVFKNIHDKNAKIIQQIDKSHKNGFAFFGHGYQQKKTKRRILTDFGRNDSRF